MDIMLAFPAQLSQHLRSFRKSRGLSQSQLAVLMGVAQSRIAAIEKDATKLTATQLLRVLAALNVGLILRSRDVDLTSSAAKSRTESSEGSPMEGQW
jgi:HTH-type transcriptional regulator/antitoxin HipB